MSRVVLNRIGVFFSCLVVLLYADHARAADGQPVALSETIGVDIDANERDAYALFPDLDGFVSARFVMISESKYRLDYIYLKDGGQKQASRSVPAKAWFDTQTHVRLVEEYQAFSARGDEPEGEDARQYAMALRYAAQAHYDLAKTLIDDLHFDNLSSPLREKAESLRTDIYGLVNAKGAFFQPAALSYDKSGRTNLMVYSGFYGIWAAIATSVALDSNSETLYAGALLVIPPASVYLAYRLSKNTDMGKGRAGIISLGGNLGTWQGLGWAGLSNMDWEAVVGVGLASGLVGIAAGSLLSSKVHFSEGHGLLTEASLWWGIWYGFVAGGLADSEGEDLLRYALIGSDVLVLATGIAARNARMSENRVRLISLSGILGGVVGSGALILVDSDNDKAIWGALGASTFAGLATGYWLTRSIDEGKDLSSRTTGSDLAWRTAEVNESSMTVKPILGAARDPFHPGRMITNVGLSIEF